MVLKKSYFYSILAVLLVIVTGCLSVRFMRVEENKVEVRTVSYEPLPANQKYLTSLDYYSLTSPSENEVVFNGTSKFDASIFDLYDNVSQDIMINSDTTNIEYDCKFNQESMQFTFNIYLLEQDGSRTIVDSQTADAFVNADGRMDAYIDIDGQQHLISEFRGENAIDNCGWFSRFIAIVIIVAIYVVVAETIEQVNARTNYKYNQQLESSGKGLAKGKYIYFQGSENVKIYKVNCAYFNKVGCEMASVYNLLIAMGRPEMLSKVIYDFELYFIEYAIGLGHLGSSPKEIHRYFDKKGIAYNKYSNFNNFRSELEKYDKCKFIMSTWNNGGALSSIFGGDGLHTYYIEKSKTGEFRAYNYYPNYDTIQNYSSIDGIYSDAGGKFIISYIIEGN